MRTTQRIATYAGSGSVLTLSGEVAAKYHLDVYQDVTEGNGRPGIGKLKRIEGIVQSPGLKVGRAQLTLLTEEGYRLQFFLVQADGTIVATSSFLTQDGRPVI